MGKYGCKAKLLSRVDGFAFQREKGTGEVVTMPESAPLRAYRGSQCRTQLWPITLDLIFHGLTEKPEKNINALKLFSSKLVLLKLPLALPRGEKKKVSFSILSVRG